MEALRNVSAYLVIVLGHFHVTVHCPSAGEFHSLECGDCRKKLKLHGFFSYN